MASLGDESNATTVCPFLTYSGYNSATDEYFCDYEPWAYGLFAIVCLLLIMMFLVLIICCVLKTRKKRKRARRLRSAVSNNSYSSSEVPYQPLLRNNRQNYGTLEQEPASTSGLSPNDESTSQQHDNTSIASSKASLLPNYDQASLEFRNSTAFNYNPKKTGSESFGKQNTKNEVDLIADSIPPFKNVPRKTKSPIYAVLEEASPDELNNKSNKESVTSTEEDPVYSELEPQENNDNSITEQHFDVESNKQLCENTDKEKKAPSGGIDELYTIPEVNYAQINKKPKIVKNPIEPVTPQELMQGEDCESTNSSPVYNILEPPLPDVGIPEEEKIQEIKENTKSPIEIQKQYSTIGKDGNCEDTKLSSECTDNIEAIYTPLLPSKERAKGNAEDPSDEPDSDNYQPLIPSEQRKRLASRTDYEEFLLEMIKDFPENERNGCFVVRDSVTNPGSKALTVYSKSSASEKELFNFKLCFDEGHIYLAKSRKRFTSLEELLQYLRTSKDMLPCTLTHQIN